MSKEGWCINHWSYLLKYQVLKLNESSKSAHPGVSARKKGMSIRPQLSRQQMGTSQLHELTSVSLTWLGLCHRMLWNYPFRNPWKAWLKWDWQRARPSRLMAQREQEAWRTHSEIQMSVVANHSYHSSKASFLRCSAFFTVQLSHPYMTTGKKT